MSFGSRPGASWRRGQPVKAPGFSRGEMSRSLLKGPAKGQPSPMRRCGLGGECDLTATSSSSGTASQGRCCLYRWQRLAAEPVTQYSGGEAQHAYLCLLMHRGGIGNAVRIRAEGSVTSYCAMSASACRVPGLKRGHSKTQWLVISLGTWWPQKTEGSWEREDMGHEPIRAPSQPDRTASCSRRPPLDRSITEHRVTCVLRARLPTVVPPRLTGSYDAGRMDGS